MVTKSPRRIARKSFFFLFVIVLDFEKLFVISSRVCFRSKNTFQSTENNANEIQQPVPRLF